MNESKNWMKKFLTPYCFQKKSEEEPKDIVDLVCEVSWYFYVEAQVVGRRKYRTKEGIPEFASEKNGRVNS